MVNRPIHIRKNLHAYSDPGFRKERIGQMVTDLLELQKSMQRVLSSRLDESMQLNSAMSILNDDFVEVIDETRYHDSYQSKRAFFNRLCYDILYGLENDKSDCPNMNNFRRLNFYQHE